MVKANHTFDVHMRVPNELESSVLDEINKKVEKGVFLFKECHSPDVSCDFYEGDVPINGACHHVLGNCRFFKYLALDKKTGEVAGVVCSYNLPQIS